MSNYELFSKDPGLWGEAFQSLWGHLDICPSLNQFHVTSITHSLTSLKAWGNAEKFCSDVAFLLVLTEEGAVRDRVYGLSVIWVNRYQARVPTVEEVVKQLTTLVSTRPNWPYALVQFNGDTCHVPLPGEGHLSTLVEEGTSSATCRRVCQLLSLSSQVIYPVGLNGCGVPMIASPPEWLAKGTNLLGSKPIYLKVDIPQSITEGPELKVSPLSSHSSSILMPSPGRAPLPKTEREVSLTIEVRELLSQVVLDMSGHASGNSTLKRLDPMVLLTPTPARLGDFPRPVDTSSQVSTPDDAEMGDASWRKFPLPPLHSWDTRPSGCTPLTDAGHLWEEANKALGELLATKSSIDTHQWKLVWELGMALCQNDSETTESIKEAKAICAHSTQEAETPWPSGRQGPGEPLRLIHFNDPMLNQSSIWKNKWLRRRVRVSLTSSLPVKPPYEPALWNSVVCW